jgi:predicted RNA-binding Zn-ribbon protein involved in translation (DUF1610 family)
VSGQSPKPERSRNWRCLKCGKPLGRLHLVRGGYARLVADLLAVRAVEVCGHDVRYVCRKCGETRVWHTAANEGAEYSENHSGANMRSV